MEVVNALFYQVVQKFLNEVQNEDPVCIYDVWTMMNLFIFDKTDLYKLSNVYGLNLQKLAYTTMPKIDWQVAEENWKHLYLNSLKDYMPIVIPEFYPVQQSIGSLLQWLSFDSWDTKWNPLM